ncbi:MAG: hypothetical protein IH789_12855 [Acidobacteria bacterium]|nr:hypothetical protein [Acidobacteriota bacterium]
MSASNVIRWAGLSLVVTGVLLVVGPIIHPEDDPTSLATSLWAIAHYLALGSLVFGVLGTFGLYARQVEEAGLLGLVGFLMLFVALALFTGLAFFEAFILPVLATEAPQFVGGLFAGEISLGVLETVILVAGLVEIIGGLLFGIAIIRAGILPRWAAILFIIGILPGRFGPEVVARISSVVLGIGLAWLGYALWSERREEASEPLPAMQS